MIRFQYFFLMGYLNHKEDIHTYCRKAFLPPFLYFSLQSPYFLPYYAYDLNRRLVQDICNSKTKPPSLFLYQPTVYQEDIINAFSP